MSALVTFADLSLIATGITFTIGLALGIWIGNRR